MLTSDEIRASWEAERESLRLRCKQRGFNPKSIDKFINNFINSMVYAKIPWAPIHLTHQG